MIEIGSACDPGIKRKSKPNQDSIGLELSGLKKGKPIFLIVADGMGGFQEGEKASQLTVSEFMKSFKRRFRKTNWKSILVEGANHSHKKIKSYIRKHSEIINMGTTAAAVILDSKQGLLLNIGDSRIYIINEQEIKQASFDHSLVAEQVRHGIIKPEEAINHPRRNVLMLSISSKHEKIEPFVNSFRINERDHILLCSDGLWGSVSESQIKDVVLELSPQEAADKLVKMANMNQGPDNISVIIARIT